MQRQIVSRQSGFVAFAMVVASLLIGGCGHEGNLADRKELSGGLWSVRLTSPAFLNGEAIPMKYAQAGQNLSPPLQWTGGPAGVKQWVLVVQDADSKSSQPAIHWLVYGIPASVHELAEGASATLPYKQGKNYKNETGYAGPAPKPGDTHRYFFQIFALDTDIGMEPGTDFDQLLKQIKARNAFVLGKGELVGKFTLPKEK